jgi:hypothetical protein
MVVKGHFDGEKIVLDEAVPDGVAANTPVTIEFAATSAASTHEENVLDRLAEMAVDLDAPPDFSVQHEHYVKGLPRR